jgi:hypothetical protein
MLGKNRRINLLAAAFTACPSCCRANRLRQLSLYVYCQECGWDSASAFIESGGFDALIYEYETKLERESKQAASVQRQLEEKQKHNKWRAI